MGTEISYSTNRSDELTLVFKSPQKLPENVHEAITDLLTQAFYTADEQLLSGEGFTESEDVRKNRFHD
jgi:hypothetical protein